MNLKPVGVFDSGIGGLSVWKELVCELPYESFHYYADSAHCPYGPKSSSEIIAYAKKITDFLISKGCKLIVVACNTATAAAITYLRKNYKIPFVGMEPAVKPAALNTKTGNIGVLATTGTFDGDLFKRTSKKYAAHINLHIQVGRGLAELVDSGEFSSGEAEDLVRKYIEPMLANNVDHIILGSTHYPFLIHHIERLTNNRIIIVNPAPAVAKQTKQVLYKMGLAKDKNKPTAEYIFYTTGNPEILRTVLKKISAVNFDINKIEE